MKRLAKSIGSSSSGGNPPSRVMSDTKRRKNGNSRAGQFTNRNGSSELLGHTFDLEQAGIRQLHVIDHGVVAGGFGLEMDVALVGLVAEFGGIDINLDTQIRLVRRVAQKLVDVGVLER